MNDSPSAAQSMPAIASPNVANIPPTVSLMPAQSMPMMASLSVVKNSALKFGIGFEMSEAYLLKAFCEKVLDELFEYRINSQKQNN